MLAIRGELKWTQAASIVGVQAQTLKTNVASMINRLPQESREQIAQLLEDDVRYPATTREWK